MSNDKRCKSCGASFAGDTAEEALAAHLDSFHPAGAPVERVVQAIGKDFGPAVSGLAGKIGDVSLVVDDHEERLKALEQDRRSGTDLDVLAEQVAGKLRASAATIPPAAPAVEATSTSTEPATVAELEAGFTRDELNAQATELGVEEPEGLANKAEVAAAIVEAKAAVSTTGD